MDENTPLAAREAAPARRRRALALALVTTALCLVGARRSRGQRAAIAALGAVAQPVRTQPPAPCIGKRRLPIAGLVGGEEFLHQIPLDALFRQLGRDHALRGAAPPQAEPQREGGEAPPPHREAPPPPQAP